MCKLLVEGREGQGDEATASSSKSTDSGGDRTTLPESGHQQSVPLTHGGERGFESKLLGKVSRGL